MSENASLSRFFGGLKFGFGGGFMLLPLIVLFLLFCLGDDLLEFLDTVSKAKPDSNVTVLCSRWLLLLIEYKTKE